jgi:TonB family protein
VRQPILVLAACLGPFGCVSTQASSGAIQQISTEPTSCAAVKSADSTIYDTSQVSEPPVPRSVPALEYPAEARKKKVHGRAVVIAVVGADGVVEPPSVTIAVSAHALLDAEARRVVSAATFWPACREGAAVRARIVIPFDFKMSDKTTEAGFAILVGVWAGMMGAMMN